LRTVAPRPRGRATAEAGTRPEFFHEDDHGAATYVDGTHHDYPERLDRDPAGTGSKENPGYMVIPFGPRNDRDGMLDRYPHAFGANNDILHLCKEYKVRNMGHGAKGEVD
jgi:hypothetical protein